MVPPVITLQKRLNVSAEFRDNSTTSRSRLDLTLLSLNRLRIEVERVLTYRLFLLRRVTRDEISSVVRQSVASSDVGAATCHDNRRVWRHGRPGRRLSAGEAIPASYCRRVAAAGERARDPHRTRGRRRGRLSGLAPES